MTFTYTEDLTVNRDYLRFHTGDVVSGENFLSDEIITSLLATYATKQAATLAAIEHIITRLSTPTIKADWLEVDPKTAITGYQMLLENKRREFGADSVICDPVYAYRADSAQIDESDYAYGRPGRNGVTYDGNPFPT